MDKKLTKEEFLEKLKIDRDFNNRYGRNHITEGKMVLPPCHYGFQVYTRELSREERKEILYSKFRKGPIIVNGESYVECAPTDINFEFFNIPTRAISLMWNQRSCDLFLGIPFNIASYGLLLEIIAKQVNMVPEELIGNLGDVHLYSNHIEQAKEQIGRDLTLDERFELWTNKGNENAMDTYTNYIHDSSKHNFLSDRHQGSVPKRTREPYPLPKLVFNPIFLANLEHKGFDEAINGQINFQIEDYQSHPTIKAPLSN